MLEKGLLKIFILLAVSFAAVTCQRAGGWPTDHNASLRLTILIALAVIAILRVIYLRRALNPANRDRNSDRTRELEKIGSSTEGKEKWSKPEDDVDTGQTKEQPAAQVRAPELEKLRPNSLMSELQKRKNHLL